jgi:hypothetical protein
MEELDLSVFDNLLREAFKKCFGTEFTAPMTEAEGKIFCNKILDQTGLSLGWKSVKNYSIFILNPSTDRQENPSLATLDTLARYVLAAPYTTEIQRKDNEGHFPYWFMYREKYVGTVSKRPIGQMNRKLAALLAAGAALVILAMLVWISLRHTGAFTDNFTDNSDDRLAGAGWSLKHPEKRWWEKRNITPGLLTLFTLRGDTWPDPSVKPSMPDLLLHEITSDCFTAEVHFKNFVPTQEWQQAGLLLLEDTTLTGKSIRLSLAFNDNFGGAKQPSEIIVQAITSLGNEVGEPEEIAHKPVAHPDSLRTIPQFAANLANSALRIEKQGNSFRFLFAGGAAENSAFRQVAIHQFDMHPRYIGIFAMKGFKNSQTVPVQVKYFRLSADNCR